MLFQGLHSLQFLNEFLSEILLVQHEVGLLLQILAMLLERFFQKGLHLVIFLIQISQEKVCVIDDLDEVV